MLRNLTMFLFLVYVVIGNIWTNPTTNLASWSLQASYPISFLPGLTSMALAKL